VIEHGFSARAVAHCVIQDAHNAGKPLHRTTVYKLVHLAHVRFQDEYGVPLVADKFVEWKYGPMVESLYHDLKIFGMSTIDPEAGFFPVWEKLPLSAVEARQIVRSVVSDYGAAAFHDLVDKSQAVSKRMKP
jgi:uncharacterized phage-associated protein